MYKYKCSDSNVICYDKSKCHFKVQICQNFDISYLTDEKPEVNNKLPAIEKQVFCSNLLREKCPNTKFFLVCIFVYSQSTSNM